MSSRRDAYTTRFLNEARTMLLSQLDTAGHGTLRHTAIAREDDRDVFSAEFTLIGRPGIMFVLRRTAYSPQLDAALSADSAVSTLFGHLLELIHRPAAPPPGSTDTVVVSL